MEPKPVKPKKRGFIAGAKKKVRRIGMALGMSSLPMIPTLIGMFTGSDDQNQGVQPEWAPFDMLDNGDKSPYFIPLTMIGIVLSIIFCMVAFLCFLKEKKSKSKKGKGSKKSGKKSIHSETSQIDENENDNN